MNLTDLKYIKNRFQLVRKLQKLKITEAGQDSDGTPFIRINNGTIFYGFLPSQKQRKYYNLLPSKVKKKLPFECFDVANDVVVRYFEGGLKYGGPKKEQFYKVQTEDQIAEMGAYLGHYTIYLAQKVGEKGRVIAIEPMPENLPLLRKNIEANKLTNVIIVPKGVWKEKDTIVFNKKLGDNQSGSMELLYSNNEEFSIPVDSLDNILENTGIEKIDFMLIQLNGVEYDALQGLTKFKPTNFSIAARYNIRNEKIVPKILNWLTTRNYDVEIVNEKFIFAKIKD